MIYAAVILDILRRFWRPIAAIAAAVTAYWRGRSDASAKQDERALGALQGRAKVDDAINRLPDDAVRRELRKWKRPE